MAIYTAVYAAYIYSGGSWVDVTSSVLDVTGSAEATLNTDNALAFGDSSQSRISVRGKLALQSYTWSYTPFRVKYGMNGDTPTKEFQGVITERERTLSDLTFTCEGYAALIHNVKAYSPMFYNRPVATKTTVASVEDPTDPSYVAGPINWLLWQAGGRPLEQDVTYPSATFYYSLDQAMFAPPFAWFAGEDGWSECLKLVQAAGGQIYQNTDGTIVYRQPFVIAEGSPSFAFTMSDFADLRERTSARKTMDTATVSFIPRELRPTQDVAEDTTTRVIQAGEAITFEVEPKWPLYSMEAFTSDSFSICFLTGNQATFSTDYTVTTTFAAQRITINVANQTSEPLVFYKVTIRGMPILPLEAQSVTVGSGSSAKTICDGNPYIQTHADAEWLANLYLAFYGDNHPLRTISGAVYDADLDIGDIATITASPLSLSGVDHVVVAKRHSQTGAEMEVDLVEITGLPTSSDFFVVGTDYSASGAKLIGW